MVLVLLVVLVLVVLVLVVLVLVLVLLVGARSLSESGIDAKSKRINENL